MRSRLEFFAALFVTIVFGGVLAVAAFRYVLPALAPFLIAWIIAAAVKKPAGHISARTHISERIVRLALSLGAVILLFSLVFLAVWQGSAAVWGFISDIGEEGFYSILSTLTDIPILSHSGITPELSARIEQAVGDMLSRLLSFAASAVTSWVSAVPNALFFILVTVIALVYIALDLERINAWLISLVPEKHRSTVCSFKSRFFSVCKKYLRSYALLLLITFSIMLAGLLILGVDHAVLIASVMAVFDLLPIIGVGTVLVPWSVFCFISTDVTLGAGLLVLFVINTVVRQLTEPKILGKSLNMHPLLTLVLLYAGYSVLGFLGLLLVPIFAIAIGVLSERREATQ